MQISATRGHLNALDAKSMTDRITSLIGKPAGVLVILAEGDAPSNGAVGNVDLAVFNVTTNEMIVAAIQLLRLVADADPLRLVIVNAICGMLGFKVDATYVPAPSEMN